MIPVCIIESTSGWNRIWSNLCSRNAQEAAEAREYIGDYRRSRSISSSLRMIQDSIARFAQKLARKLQESRGELSIDASRARAPETFTYSMQLQETLMLRHRGDIDFSYY